MKESSPEAAGGGEAVQKVKKNKEEDPQQQLADPPPPPPLPPLIARYRTVPRVSGPGGSVFKSPPGSGSVFDICSDPDPAKSNLAIKIHCLTFVHIFHDFHLKKLIIP